jgi:hypothetical protein
MKKFFTFLLTLVLVCAINAQPQPMMEYPSHPIKTPNQQLPSRKATTHKRALELATTADRQAILKQEPLPNAPSTKPMAKATQEVIQLNYTKVHNLKYYSDTKDWFFYLKGEDKSQMEYYYMIKLDYFAPADNYCGTFTKEDFNLQYAFIVYNNYANIYYDDITVTISEEQRGSLSIITVDGTIWGSDGVTYEIHCVEERINPKSEYTSLITNATLTQANQTITLDGKNEQMDAHLVLNSTKASPLGSYKLEDINLNASQLNDNNTAIQIMDATVEITSSELYGVMTYIAKASILSTDTLMYHIEWQAPLPDPVDTITIVCPNLQVSDEYASYLGYVMADAYNDEWFVDLQLPNQKAEPGQYNYGVACSIYVRATEEEIKSHKTKLKLSLDAKNNWVIQGSALGENNVLYLLDLSWTAPEVTKVVKVTFDTSAEATYWVKDNDLQLANVNDDFYASLEVFGKQPGEPFGWESMVHDFSGVLDYTAENAYAEIADATNGMIQQVGDTTILSASLIAFTGTQYDVELWYVAPTPTDTVEMTIPVEFNNLLESGVFQLYGYTPDSTMFLSFAPFSHELDGTFINDGMFGRFGLEGGRCDFFDDYTYVGTVDEKGKEKLHFVQKGQMTVSMDEDNNITALVDVVCDNAVRYLLTLTSKYVEYHLLYDEPYASVNRTYTSNDELWIDDYTELYSTIFVDITAADGSDKIALEFYAEEADPLIGVPEGVYPINNTMDYGTVASSAGIEGNYIYPSFYGWLADDGSVITPLWMMTSGTVTVTKVKRKLRIEIDAVNSYKVPIHIVYDGTLKGTDIENIVSDDVKIEKIIKNGQLIIIHNDRKYNAQGIVIK